MLLVILTQNSPVFSKVRTNNRIARNKSSLDVQRRTARLSGFQKLLARNQAETLLNLPDVGKIDVR